jgi:hypothetical protein
MVKKSKSDTARNRRAAEPKKRRIILPKIDRRPMDPSALMAVSSWVAQRRQQEAAFDAKYKYPSSYGSGCRDGAAIAEGVLLNVARGWGASNTPLIDHLSLAAGPTARDEYRRGVLVGYLSEMHEWVEAHIRSIAKEAANGEQITRRVP